MEYGSGLPFIAESDPAPVREAALTLEGAGFDFVTIGGHVLAARAGRYEGRPPQTYVGPFHDPFVLYAYLAGITSRIHFLSSVVILPLLPTALVAKQSAALQSLSGGRFELGVGISWNADEYQALGQSLNTRGARFDEQLELLQKLWADRYVSFDGAFDTVDDLGLNTPPVRIPIWIGAGHGKTQLRRIAKHADGWMPLGDAIPLMPSLREALLAEGRDPAAFKVMGRLAVSPGEQDAWVDGARRLQAAGVTHINISNGAPSEVRAEDGLATVVDARRVIAEALG